MDIEGDLIWGDDDESVVFAQAQRHDRSITFMFANKSKYTQSLPNRIVTCFHDLPVEDWEQSGAAPYTLAPEADGAWDVKEMATGASTEETANSATPRLVYEKYSGPYRENLAWGQPKWNVFPSWKDTCPRALDAAEVFSLGRTMWMLLNGVTQSELEDSDEVVMSWNDAAEDVPNEWKDIVGRCLDPDPNARIGLRQLVDFWKVVTREDVA